MSQSKRYVIINRAGNRVDTFDSAHAAAVFLWGKLGSEYDVYCLVPDRGVRDVAGIEWDLDEVWDRLQAYSATRDTSNDGGKINQC